MLRNSYKAAANYARGAVEILDSAVRIAYGLRFKRAELSRRHKKAIVLGNGPSLKVDYGALEAAARQADADLWCVNFFGNSPEYQKLRPNNYVIADPGHWEDDVTDELKVAREKFLTVVTKATQWEVLFHFPHSAKDTDFVARLAAHPLIRIRFFNPTTVPCRYKPLLFWFYRHELAMPAPQNVLIPAIFLCILSHYQEVLLLGADHSWHGDIAVKDSTVMIRDKHFYDDEVQLKPFFKNSTETFSMAEIFYIWGKVFAQYELLASFSKDCGVEVTNASSTTFIDSFRQGTLRYPAAPS
jgi:hypothetical protein